MLNRKLAGLAAGAMSAGVLFAPGVMGVANAATTATYDITYSCVGFGQTVPFETTAAVTTAAAGPVANTVSVQLGDFPGAIPVALNDRNWKIDTTVNDGTADIELTGTHAQSVAGSTPAPLAPAKGSAARQVDAEKLTFGAAKVTITKTDGTGNPTVMNCTVSKQALVPVEVPGPEAPEGGALFQCEIPAFKSSMAYPTTLVATAKAKGGSVEATVALQDIPIKTIPVALDNTPITGSATGKIDGKDVTFTGSRNVSIPAATDIPVPALTGTVASTAKTVDLQIAGATFVAKHPMMDVDVVCSLDAPVTIAGVAVAAEPIVNQPVVKKSSKTTISKVAVSKKSKKAKVSVKVSVGKAKATGKVTIKIAKGKKTVIKKSVKLRSGKASLTSKALKNGTYKVTVSYSGNDKTKSSKAKAKTFRVKK